VRSAWRRGSFLPLSHKGRGRSNERRYPVDAQEQDVTGPLLIEHDDGIDRVCSRSEEFSEGIQAFLEKRKPVYIRR
jgi:hypothetical protein